LSDAETKSIAHGVALDAATALAATTAAAAAAAESEVLA
jgi:hypothetical protein